MNTKRNLFTGGIIAALAAGVWLAVGQKSRHSEPAGWDAEHWLSLLAGPQAATNSQTQTGQTGRPAEIIGQTGYPLYR
jgi:hypothetical protein